MGQRALDLLIGVPLLLLTLPVMLAAAVGAAISLRAWPFFAQERVGRDGRPFTVLKVRTLPTATPAYCVKGDLAVVEIPPFAALLRRLHLDELPQLLLVVLGRMSLVGPRPEMGLLHDVMDERVADERTRVRPGCTGLWQISVASEGLIHEAPEYDDFYLRHRSARLDLWIIGRTAGLMLLHRPKIDLGAVPEWACRSADDRALQSAGIGALLD